MRIKRLHKKISVALLVFTVTVMIVFNESSRPVWLRSVSGMFSFNQLYYRTDLDVNDKDVLVVLNIPRTGILGLTEAIVKHAQLEKPCYCKPYRTKCLCLNRNNQHWMFNAWNSTGFICGENAGYTEIKNKCPIDHWFKTTGHDKRPYRRYHVMTMLRDPLSRYVSEWVDLTKRDWNFLNEPRLWRKQATELQKKGSKCMMGKKLKDFTLSDFVKCPDNPANNRMTKMLANKNYVDSLKLKTPAKYNQALLKSAMNVLGRAVFFGLHAKPNDSQVLFEEVLGARLSTRLSFKFMDDTYTNISPADKHKILLVNDLDFKLYAFAKELFEARMAEWNELYKKEEPKKVEPQATPTTPKPYVESERMKLLKLAKESESLGVVKELENATGAVGGMFGIDGENGTMFSEAAREMLFGSSNDTNVTSAVGAMAASGVLAQGLGLENMQEKIANLGKGGITPMGDNVDDFFKQLAAAKAAETAATSNTDPHQQLLSTLGEKLRQLKGLGLPNQQLLQLVHQLQPKQNESSLPLQNQAAMQTPGQVIGSGAGIPSSGQQIGLTETGELSQQQQILLALLQGQGQTEQDLELGLNLFNETIIDEKNFTSVVDWLQKLPRSVEMGIGGSNLTLNNSDTSALPEESLGSLTDLESLLFGTASNTTNSSLNLGEDLTGFGPEMVQGLNGSVLGDEFSLESLVKASELSTGLNSNGYLGPTGPSGPNVQSEAGSQSSFGDVNFGAMPLKPELSLGENKQKKSSFFSSVKSLFGLKKNAQIEDGNMDKNTGLDGIPEVGGQSLGTLELKPDLLSEKGQNLSSGNNSQLNQFISQQVLSLDSPKVGEISSSSDFFFDGSSTMKDPSIVKMDIPLIDTAKELNQSSPTFGLGKNLIPTAGGLLNTSSPINTVSTGSDLSNAGSSPFGAMMNQEGTSDFPGDLSDDLGGLGQDNLQQPKPGNLGSKLFPRLFGAPDLQGGIDQSHTDLDLRASPLPINPDYPQSNYPSATSGVDELDDLEKELNVGRMMTPDRFPEDALDESLTGGLDGIKTKSFLTEDTMDERLADNLSGIKPNPYSTQNEPSENESGALYDIKTNPFQTEGSIANSLTTGSGIKTNPLLTATSVDDSLGGNLNSIKTKPFMMEGSLGDEMVGKKYFPFLTQDEKEVRSMFV